LVLLNSRYSSTFDTRFAAVHARDFDIKVSRSKIVKK
jgi:hypothetical protein